MSSFMTGQIIRQCLQLDCKAVSFYRALLRRADGDDELRTLWETMISEELKHVTFWKELISYCADGMLPELFDKPTAVHQELEQLVRRVDALLDNLDERLQCHSPYALALRLEFYLLHPAVLTLFAYLRDVHVLSPPFDDYEQHLGHILEQMRQREPEALELELLGEAVHNIWRLFEERTLKALQDYLTGVLNRRGFEIAMDPLLHLARRNGEPVGFLLFDVDKLHLINETYGHATGDQVLIRLARAIQQHLRHSDVVARSGDDTFAVLLYPVETGSMETLAEKIRTTAREALSDLAPVTISAGGAAGYLQKHAVDEAHSLLVRAERALRQVRAQGLILIDQGPGRRAATVARPR